MTKVTLKKELHSSSGDLEEERELLKEGYEVLILEGSQSDPEYGLLPGWFTLAFELMFSTIGRVQQSKSILVDFAEVSDIDLKFTRESEAEILNNAPVLVRFISGSLFYLLFGISLLYGALTGDYFRGALLLLFAAGLPLAIIRFYNMYARRGDENRDRIIANHIIDASESHESILVIVGAAHGDGVLQRLPDEFEIEVIEPKYGVWSWSNIREIIRPLSLGYATILGVYVMILFIYETYLLTI